MKTTVYRRSPERRRIQAEYTDVRRFDPATGASFPCTRGEAVGAWKMLDDDDRARIRESDTEDVYILRLPSTKTSYELRKPGAQNGPVFVEPRAEQLARLAVEQVAEQEERERAERDKPGAYDAVTARIVYAGRDRDVVIVTTSDPDAFLALHGQDGDDLAQSVKRRAADQQAERTREKRGKLGPYLAALARVLRSSGMTIPQIADEFGVSRPTLYRYLNREDGAA